MYRDFCPVGNAEALSTCTSFTEDDKVFAVVGVFIDQSGDAQLCIAKNHETVEIIHNVSQSWIDEAPKGLLLTPNITTDRRLSVILDLLAQRQDAQGQEGGGAHPARQQGPRRAMVTPALKKMKVKQGSTAVLSITGTDTTAAQSQLDSFIEKWKAEGVDTFVIVGQTVVSKTYVTILKEAFPKATLISDQTPTALSGGQDAVAAKEDPNPYEGLISAEGQSRAGAVRDADDAAVREDLREGDRQEGRRAEGREAERGRQARRDLRVGRGRVRRRQCSSRPSPRRRART